MSANSTYARCQMQAGIQTHIHIYVRKRIKETNGNNRGSGYVNGFFTMCVYYTYV